MSDNKLEVTASAQQQPSQQRSTQKESELPENAQVANGQSANEQVSLARFPKRLLILMVVYILTSVSGLLASDTSNKQSLLFCVLTLMLVAAVFGRQKAALYMLRGYAVVQMAFYSMLPLLMSGDATPREPTRFEVGPYFIELGDWFIYGLLFALGLWQLWVSFSKSVANCFVRKVNMNILS
ncbi:hypothetical protein [Shewanella sp. WXL01]|uniref:hypothetical protein n=1 Tax=Shewanella sp. WXL01 TaxID=2709721 RepID=UPI001FD9F013|nr:hypothetical protein [Shewanella sp. WXL01]